MFSNDDIQLLNTFTYQAGIAIVNAQLYQEVKDFNVTLQGKIDRTTEHLRKSNEELRLANIHTEGTGLGLYVARQIMEAHKGTIWADSPGKDQGSTFSFWMEGERV